MEGEGKGSMLSAAGVIPMLGAPMAGASDQLLAQAVEAAAGRGLVGPDDHVVREQDVGDAAA